MFWSSIILLLSAIILFYKWYTKNFGFFKNKGIKYIKPSQQIYWPFRSASIAEFMIDSYTRYPDEKVVGMFQFRRPIYLIRCPEIVKKIAIKDFSHFQDHSEIFDNFDDMFSSVLMALKGKRWREMRLALTPAFTGSKMRLMLQFINKCCEQFVDFINSELEKSKEKLFPIKDVFAKYTNDVVATCAFGVECDSFKEPNNEIFLIGKELGDFQKPSKAYKIGFNFFFPRLARFLGITAFNNNMKKRFREIIIETMKTREQNGIVRPDMINILMELKKSQDSNSEKSQTWTETELVAQSFQFFIAGYESISQLMTFVAYELATNPESQEKLIQEVDETHERLGGEPITYEALIGMKYLNMVILEVLRIWTPAVATDRLCVEDYNYEDDSGNKFTIEKGALISIPIYAFHHDPAFFPNHDKFEPERFSEENNPNMDAFMPFGIGPRNCIANRFALMETKAIFYYILRKFKLMVGKETQVPLQLRKTLIGIFPDKPVVLHFKKR